MVAFTAGMSQQSYYGGSGLVLGGAASLSVAGVLAIIGLPMIVSGLGMRAGKAHVALGPGGFVVGGSF